MVFRNSHVWEIWTLYMEARGRSDSSEKLDFDAIAPFHREVTLTRANVISEKRGLLCQFPNISNVIFFPNLNLRKNIMSYFR